MKGKDEICFNMNHLKCEYCKRTLKQQAVKDTYNEVFSYWNNFKKNNLDNNVVLVKFHNWLLNKKKTYGVE